MAAEQQPRGLPFGEAIDYLRRKVDLPTQRWDDLLRHAHVRAFTIAGVAQAEMLGDFRAAIDRARAEGSGFDAFRKTFDEIVDRTGWTFNARGSTDEERRDWRARVIYNTNMRTSYMAGRWEQMTDPDVLRYRPYWRYRHNYARHPRKQHLAWNGKVWMADNPVWRVIYPPNGWGCNCDVEALSEGQFQALGKSSPDPTPDLNSRVAKDPRTGEPETRYDGIDRGWEYNVGEASRDGPVPRELQAPLRPAPRPSDVQPVSMPDLPPKPPAGPARPPEPAEPPAQLSKLPPLPEPRPVPESRLMPAGRPEVEYVSAFLEEFGAGMEMPVLHRDRSGGVVTISKALFEQRDASGQTVRLKVTKRGRERFVRLMADAIIDPDEIWANWALSGDGSPVLIRSYLRRMQVGGRQIFVMFVWSGRGWTATTAFDTSEAYLARQRIGALLYRRKEEAAPAAGTA